MNNTHTKHNQQSTEDTKHAEKKPQTSLQNCKITGIQNNSHADLNFNMHQPSGTHIRQKIHTTLTKYKTMQQDGTIMTTHTTQVSLPYKNN